MRHFANPSFWEYQTATSDVLKICQSARNARINEPRGFALVYPKIARQVGDRQPRLSQTAI